MADELNPLTDDDALARLADGTLPEADAERLRARVGGSATLRARLAEQERAVALMRATDDVAAPASLRTAVAAMATADGRAARPAGRRALSWRPALVVPGTALAVAVVVVAIVLATGGSPTGPTVSQTARLALAAATSPAPAVQRGDRDRLAISQSGIPFPSYVSDTRWRVSGARRDTLHGRRVTTVFYRTPAGRRVGYSIVAGPALTFPSGRVWTFGSIRYVVAARGSTDLVTWRRDGHTCVIAGRNLSSQSLLTLAADDERTT